jgi:hypothetical protein
MSARVSLPGAAGVSLHRRHRIGRAGNHFGQRRRQCLDTRVAFDAELANALAIETGDGFGEATEFLHRFFSGTAKQRARLVPKAPLAAIQRAALGHQDPFMRRGCLFFLDHYANDESMGIFARALHDPVAFVRNAALHSLTCGTCKRSDLCVADVVPGLIDVLEHDLSVEMRTKAIPLLLMLSGQDSRAKPAVERAAQVDPDDLIRRACADGLAGRFVAPRKRYERRQRRHARTAANRQRV